MTSGLRIARLSQRLRWTLRGMRRGMWGCCGRLRRDEIEDSRAACFENRELVVWLAIGGRQADSAGWSEAS
jgi:hypothetical protein